MSRADSSTSSMRVLGVIRVSVGLAALGILAYAYALRLSAGDGNPFDFFGYFTNQTSAFAAGVLIASGISAVKDRPASSLLNALRAVATSYLIVVAVIYNLLVPGTGSAPPWVSMALHAVLPLAVIADWAFAPDRRRLPWRRIWIVLPYPVIWLVVVLLRGITDGWVPYGFLLPERGAASLWLHVIGLVVALLAAAAGVWLLSRTRVLATKRAEREEQPA